MLLLFYTTIPDGEPVLYQSRFHLNLLHKIVMSITMLPMIYILLCTREKLIQYISKGVLETVKSLQSFLEERNHIDMSNI